MRTLRFLAVAAATVGLLLMATPAQAWDNGTYLRTGDVFCTDQTSSPTGARFNGHIVNGTGTAGIRTSATAGGPETEVWSQNGANLNFNKHVYAAAGTHYRGCVTITAHTVNTWGKAFILGLGSTSVGDIGPHQATLAPGGRACGDWGMETVNLTGTANATITWYVTATDHDYAYVGTVFSTTGVTVNTNYTATPDLADLEMCVHNSSQQTVSVTYEMSLV